MADRAATAPDRRPEERSFTSYSHIPYRFRFLPSSSEEASSSSSPVHRPPKKYSNNQRCLAVMHDAFYQGYTLGFLSYATEVVYKVYRDKNHLLYSAHPDKKHLRYAVVGAVTVGALGGLPFGIHCCVLRGAEFGLEKLRGVRDILNLTVAGGLGFGALHIFSMENLVTSLKNQPRFRGRFPLMVAAGATVGFLSHAVELAFFDYSTAARRSFSERLHGGSRLSRLDTN